jgi:hypothetical protein
MENEQGSTERESDRPWTVYDSTMMALGFSFLGWIVYCMSSSCIDTEKYRTLQDLNRIVDINESGVASQEEWSRAYGLIGLNYDSEESKPLDDICPSRKKRIEYLLTTHEVKGRPLSAVYDSDADELFAVIESSNGEKTMCRSAQDRSYNAKNLAKIIEVESEDGDTEELLFRGREEEGVFYITEFYNGK